MLWIFILNNIAKIRISITYVTSRLLVLKKYGIFENITKFFVYQVIRLLIDYLFNQNEVKSMFDEGKVGTFLNKS